jgi:SAM-dependent methyltransferase
MICRVCDSNRLEPVIDLGLQPWCNHFLTADEIGKEPFYPLRVVYCMDCQTSQLDYTVAKEVMFGDHTYLSGVTKSLDQHFREIAVQVDEAFFKTKPAGNKSILDIGSNDGTQLKHYKELGYEVVGIESSKGTAKIANDQGINTIQAFFNEQLVDSLNRKFDVINASGVFFHLEELHSVTEGIRKALKQDGVFVVQFLYMKSIIENCAFDQIYHEHLLYYTLKTINTLLGRHELEMFDCRLASIHGGSIIGYVGHKGNRDQTKRYEEMLEREQVSGINDIQTYRRFAKRIATMKKTNMDYLEAAVAQGKRIYGMGAPVKGNTMLNYFGVDQRLIPKLVEKNTLRKGLFAPGSHIPVVLENELKEPPDIYYVLAWNFKKEILANNKALIAEGVEFYFPVDPDLNTENPVT